VFLSSFTFPTANLIIGGIFGLVLGYLAARFMFKRGIFKRVNKFYNLLTKMYYLYIILIFVICGSLIIGVWGLRSQMRKAFDRVDSLVIQRSFEATTNSINDLNMSLKGRDLEPGLLVEVSLVITHYNEEELNPIFLSGPPILAEGYKKASATIYRKLENSITNRLDKALQGNKTISLELLNAVLKEDIIPDIKEGYVADLAWDSMSSMVFPYYLGIFLRGLLFFSLIFIEPFFYFLYSHVFKKKKQKKNLISFEAEI
jgi:hypothetical protein